ncbi:Alcohol dehydrogenase, putative [Ricinus communis]|uniref:Alcohol dehydrogenase, putative n=1 Tax=Ricinus communis TaxID=3988 RepID=B9S259_RICCO|nr:Alcohol dehydrogenase, putative [Ricinus communis]
MSKNTSQVITCKAAVCWGAEELAIKLEEIQVEPPKSSEVRLKMLCASLCHTDILFCKGLPFPLYPRVPGHEGVRIVESVGDEVKDLKEGDFVIPTFIGECQKCENCTSEITNLCLKHPFSISGLMPDNTSRMSFRGQRLYQFFSCSTWSEYTVVNVNYVVKIDPSIPLPHASFISCGFSTGFGATWKEAKVEKGSSVAVFGLGAVGLGAIEGARLAGADKIIGIDKNGWKKEKAKAFGMTDFINSNDFDKTVSQLIKDLTGGMGVDYCFECTGVAALMDEALLSIKLISFRPLMYGGTMKGSIFGGLKVKSDFPTILEKCKNKEFHLDELLTHEVPLEDFNKAFELLKQPDCVKVVIKF